MDVAGFRITQQVPGGEPIDLTQDATAATWSSSVPGGFGAATVTLPKILTQKERGLLGAITIEHEGRVLFEGRCEDALFKGSKTAVSTDLNAFGLQRLLTDNSVRRVWSLRNSLNPVAASIAQGTSSSGTLVLAQDNIDYAFGIFTPVWPNSYPASYFSGIPLLNGFRIIPIAPIAANDTGQVVISLPTGITGARFMCDSMLASADASWTLYVHSTADGVTYTRHVQIPTAAGTTFTKIDTALVDGAREIRVGGGARGAGAGGDPTGVLNSLEISNIRVLGTQLQEDAPGGFYGGTILRDVIALAPGLYPGTIEDGSDFLISEIERVSRSSLLDVVQEIDPLYAKEWGVWEAGRFDWITPDLKAGGWLVPLADATEWSIEQSLDSVHRRTYVTFTDAADNQIKEAFADATDARNPYVRTGSAKDGIVSAPAAMTVITGPLLAAKLNNDFGRWPDIKGSVTLLAQTILSQTGNGSRAVPAFAIRAGDNITIPDLPVEDIYAAGQDGQTVFHVTGVQASTDGTVVLTLEGLTRRADVLLARLGAVSQ